EPRIVCSAENELAGQDIVTMSIYGDNAVLLNEDPARPGTRLTHSFRGEWKETAFSSRTDSPTFRVEDIDPSVVMGAIDAAPGELDMGDDASTSHVSVYPEALGEPEFVVNVSEGPSEPPGSVTVGGDGPIREVSERRGHGSVDQTADRRDLLDRPGCDHEHRDAGGLPLGDLPAHLGLVADDRGGLDHLVGHRGGGLLLAARTEQLGDAVDVVGEAHAPEGLGVEV